MLMQDSFDAGNKAGVEQARNEMKLIMIRERNRRKLKQQVKKTDDAIRAMVKKGLPKGKKKKRSRFQSNSTWSWNG